MSSKSPSKQLFLEFSNDYCDNGTYWGTRSLTWGKGAAYDFEGFVKLLKILPHSCISDYYTNISRSTNDTYKSKFGKFIGSGSSQLSLPYKFLQILDPDAFKEIQQSAYASVSHAIRNAADLSRACALFWEYRNDPTGNALYKWEARGAVEPMFHYASNSLVNNLLFIGPNIIASGNSLKRGIGCQGHQLSCAPELMGAFHFCECPKSPDGFQLPCPPTPKVCTVGDDCRKKSCFDRAVCANEPFATSGDFLFRDDQFLHAGYFVRKSYGGYGNFINNGNFFGTQDDTIFLDYAQAQNGFNYTQATYDRHLTEFYIYKNKPNLPADPPVLRAKNVSMVSTTAQAKDLIHNGYGIVISTNVGFSDKRNSIGISYPDRIWYHTFAIVGCDDTKRLYPEALFLAVNSWGDWNSGGEPDWGPIPKGSFLITESHLACIINQWPRVDQFKDCNPRYIKNCFPYFPEDTNQIINWIPTSLTEASALDGILFKINRAERRFWVRTTCSGTVIRHLSEKRCNRLLRDELRNTQSCGDNCKPLGDCDFTTCTSNQAPWGVAFVISFDDDPPYIRKDLRYSQFFPSVSPQSYLEFSSYGISDVNEFGWKVLPGIYGNSAIQTSIETDTFKPYFNSITYDQIDSVSLINITWTFVFENSTDGGGKNDGPQGGTVQGYIMVPQDNSRYRISVSGPVEMKTAGYDKSSLTINGVEVFIESTGTNLENESCETEEKSDIKEIILPKGVHKFIMKAQSKDGSCNKDNMAHVFKIEQL